MHKIQGTASVLDEMKISCQINAQVSQLGLFLFSRASSKRWLVPPVQVATKNQHIRKETTVPKLFPWIGTGNVRISYSG